MEPRLPKIGELVAGRYRILQELGHGGYGVVYRARQDAMGRDVAIKILRPEAAKDEVEVERFRREVFHASGLRHPNTITLYDFGETNGLFYIIMEFLEGMNLRDRLMKDGALDPDRALDVTTQILKALREAHEHGIVHRDLKPENVFLCNLVDGERVVKVLDFGLSKYVPGSPEKEPTLTKDGVIFGTPQYMSPEQAYGQEISPATDIYAVGLLIYEMLTTNTAFSGRSSMEILIKQVSQPIPFLPDPHRETILADLMDICTKKNVEDRFQNAGEALQWLMSRRNEISVVTMFRDVGPDTLPQAEIEPSIDTAILAPPRQSEHDPAYAASEVTMRLAQMPLIGRETEIQSLMKWSKQAVHQGGIAAVTGPMGVGKTAIVDEWTRQMELEGAIVLRGRYRADGAVLEGLRTALRPIYDEEARRDHTLPVVLTPAKLQELRAVLEPKVRADTGEPTDMGQDWRFVCIESAVHNLARVRPTVVVLEDVHWADSFSLRLLAHWQEELATQTLPVILVLTSRTDEFGITRQLNELSRLGSRYSQVSFAFELDVLSLPDDQARQLINYVIPLNQEATSYVLKQARGNPLYLTQIARFMAEEGLLEFHDETGKWAFAAPVKRETRLVPPNLRTLWGRRVKNLVNHHPLGPVLKALLSRAALIGGRFELRLLKDVLRAEGRNDLESYLDDALDALSRASILIPTVIDGRPGVEFGFDVVRSALEDSEINADEDLGALHTLLGRVKSERHVPDDDAAGDAAAEIAVHFREAGAPRDALLWLLTAAAGADRAQDFVGALERYTGAESMLNSTLDPTGERLLEIRLAQGRLHGFLGAFGPAEFALRGALEEAQRVGDVVGEAMAGERLADVLKMLANYEQSSEMYQHVRELYRRFNDVAGEIRCNIGLAEIFRYGGHYPDAEAIFRDALSRADEASLDPDVSVRCLFGLGQCAYAAGRLDAARNLYRQARKRSEAAGDVRLVGHADIELALLAIHTTGCAESERLGLRALAQLRSVGDTVGVGFAHLVLGIAIRRSVRMSEARFHAKRALSIHERLGHNYGIAKAVLLTAEIEWMEGRLDDALQHAKDAEALHAALRDAHGLALSKCYRALIEVDRGDAETAGNLLDEAMAITGREGLGLYQPMCLMLMALVQEKQHNLEEAIQLYGESLQLAEAIGNRETASIVATGLAKLHLVFGDFEAARQEVPVAKNQAELLGSNMALIFALAGEALLARLDGNAHVLQEALRRLRAFRENKGGANLRVAERIYDMGALVIQRQRGAQRVATIEALADILDGISASEFATQLRADLAAS